MKVLVWRLSRFSSSLAHSRVFSPWLISISVFLDNKIDKRTALIAVVPNLERRCTRLLYVS
jgi:hypothetical protein